jgi:Phosphotransferase enzyme family.
VRPRTTVHKVEQAGPTWNQTTQVARVTLASGETVYCKLTPTNPEGRELRGEAAAIRYAAVNTSVTVPTVVGTTTDPVPALVTEPVRGTPVDDGWFDATPDRRETLARRLGHTLASIHAERFDCPGEIVDGDGEELIVDHAPWPDVLHSAVKQNHRLAHTDRFDLEYGRLLDAIDANRETLTGVPARLLHCDPATPNCFDTGDDRLTMLDWGNSVVGDPVRGLNRAREQSLKTLREPASNRLVTALHEGYRAVAGGLPPGFGERKPVYDAIIQLSTAGYVERFAEWREESEAELTAWFHDDLDRRLSQIE